MYCMYRQVLLAAEMVVMMTMPQLIFIENKRVVFLNTGMTSRAVLVVQNASEIQG